MSHLDEGTLSALLDGEIPSEELVPMTAHLRECPACQAQLAELRSLATEADRLVTALGDGTKMVATPPGVTRLQPRSRTKLYRQLAWAASIVLAWSLGNWTGDGGNSPAASLSDSLLSPPIASAVPDPERAVAPTPTSVPPTELEASREAPAGPRRAVAPATPPVTQQLASPTAASVAVDTPTVAGRLAGGATAEMGKAADASRERRQESVGQALRSQVEALRDASRPAPAANLAAPMPERQDVALESFAPIGFVAAVARMGGTLRLVDGLIPDRLEASSTTVRVIYPLQAGELVLEQRRLGDSISVSLRGPVPADSLAVLRRRIR